MNLIKKEKVGQGSFARIYLAEDENGTKYAVKCCMVDANLPESIYGCINLKEMEIMKHFDHPYLNKAIKISNKIPFRLSKTINEQKSDTFCIIYPYADTNLEKLCYEDPEEKKKLDLPKIFYQILSAIYYLHQYGITHRDIKTNNILLYKNKEGYDAKLTDFNQSKTMIESTKRNSTDIGTYNFRPLELILENKEYNKSIDIWAAGYMFLDVLFSEDFFNTGNGDDNESLLKCIIKKMGNPEVSDYQEIITSERSIPYFNTKEKKRDIQDIIKIGEKEKIFLKNKDIEFIDLINKMMKYKPSERLTAWDCLQHPFFSDIPKDIIQKKIEEEKIENSIPSHPKRYLGVNIISNLFNLKISSKRFQRYKNRIIFLSQDIFDRCLFAGYNKEMDILAYVSVYIATKYYLADLSPPIDIIFHDLPYDYDSLANLEKKILRKYINYRIYRLTIYDISCLEDLDNINIETLFDIRYKADYLGNRDIKRVLQSFLTEWKEIEDE